MSFINIFINKLSAFQVKKNPQETGTPFMVYASTLVCGGLRNAPHKQYNRPYSDLCQQGAPMHYMSITALINHDKIIKIVHC